MLFFESGMAAKVFISHAGEQKKVFVDVLHSFLEIEGISSFVDEYDLVPGNKNWAAIEKALKEATVGKAHSSCVLLHKADHVQQSPCIRQG